ncbi:MAG: hypothetical protein MSIBF_02285 [Candidatus Altiarchaeales archaeon IMC4]|nr:MAG: hypothetical protein MSIBF_02285 [Candidatus Altiarchaeales archaeon IMC4]
MKPTISIKGLNYTYPDGTKALSDINLEVAKNESVALIGPNGAGKTTLLLHLNGIIRNGSVEVMGMEINDRNLMKIRSSVGLVFQNPDDQLFSPTVFDDVAFGPLNMSLGEQDVMARVKESLGQVELEGYENRSCHHLSFGEKKRAAIATVLSMQPEILVLDEPTLGMDPWVKKDFLALLGKLMHLRTIIVATHDNDVLRMCDRAYLFSKGRIISEMDEFKDIEKIRIEQQ